MVHPALGRRATPVPIALDSIAPGRTNVPDHENRAPRVDRLARQRIQYLHTADGVRLAWADASGGPLLIKASTWLTHLEYEWESPLWAHWLGFLCDHFRLVRYDERGSGMTDWNVADLSLERRVEDLESVVAAVAPREPFVLLGISQGGATALAFAARHPEKVSYLVLYGSFARGWARRGESEDRLRERRAVVDLTRPGWGTDDAAFRQVLTSRFLPGATGEQVTWFNELCRKTTFSEKAAQMIEARSVTDVVDCLGEDPDPDPGAASAGRRGGSHR